MSELKILVATNQLDIVGGSETFTYAFAEELQRRGFEVEYFTFDRGFVADKIEKELNLSFMSKDKYDLIFANHNTCVDKLYKRGFTVQTCHGIFPRLEQPSRNAHAHVAISEEVQNHLAYLDIPSLLIHNGINLERFKSNRPISPKLETVLSLCHSEEANNFVKGACDELGYNFIKAYKYEQAVWDIENVINQADLVVGLGRSAYEGMACERPVIVYDSRRYFESCGDGYIRDNLGLSLKNNCSGRYSARKYDKADFMNELRKYDPADGAFFRAFVEKELDVRKNVIRYLDFAKALQKDRAKRKKDRQIKLGQTIFGVKGFKMVLDFTRKIGLH